MVYASILMFISLYLYGTRGLISNSFLKQFVVWLPCFFVFFIPMALQYNVGTDYLSYVAIYTNSANRWLYIDNNETLFLTIVDVARFFGDPQYLFAIFTLIISLTFFYSLFILQKFYALRPWAIFVIYFSVTGIYNTSFNTLRQSAVAGFLIILLHLFSQKRHILFLSLIFLLSFLHKSIYFYLIMYPLFFVKDSKKVYFFLFCATTFIYAISFNFFIEKIAQIPFVGANFAGYLYYAETGFFDAGPILSILTKLYYLPIFLLFWYLYLKDRSKNTFFDLSIKLWSVTCFMIIQMMHIGIFYRFWNLFVFLYIFPIYYIIDYYIVSRKPLAVMLLILYILLPYMVKVLFLPSAEYLYHFNNMIF